MHELELAARVAREAAPHLPVLASFSFDEEAHGADAASALVTALRPFGVTAIGVNCGSGPQAALEVARRLIEAGAPIVSVMPNAGLPERVGGRLVDPSGPEYFAAYTRQFLEAGVRIVGGC